jgi:leucine dehydrogenase
MLIKDLEFSELEAFTDFDNHQKVRRIEDSESGLIAYIAVHNTNLGPALGGCRMYDYDNESDAVRDVLRLSKGMTYKNALAKLPLGGGKSVIVGDPFKVKTEALMQAMGKAVQSFEGMYITAEDSGTNESDMKAMSSATDYVVGLPCENNDDSTKIGGDPSPHTAYGVFNGLKAAVRKKYGNDALEGLTVAIQGMGAVGYRLAQMLDDNGVKLIITDVRDENLIRAQNEFKDVTVVEPDDIFTAQANVFAPCALGAQINEKTLPLLNIDIVAGAANNQLSDPSQEVELKNKGILYTPDYVINSGGVIAVAYEYFLRSNSNPFSFELSQDNLKKHVEQIGSVLDKIFKLSDDLSDTPGHAADELAESIFNSVQSGESNEFVSTGS